MELLLLPIVIAWQDCVKGVPMWGQCFSLWRLVLELEMLPHAHRKRTNGFSQVYVREIPYLPVSEIDFTSAKEKHELMLEKQVTPMATRSNPGIQTTRTPAPASEEQKSFFSSISGPAVKPAVLSLVTP